MPETGPFTGGVHAAEAAVVCRPACLGRSQLLSYGDRDGGGTLAFRCISSYLIPTITPNLLPWLLPHPDYSRRLNLSDLHYVISFLQPIVNRSKHDIFLGSCRLFLWRGKPLC